MFKSFFTRHPRATDPTDASAETFRVNPENEDQHGSLIASARQLQRIGQLDAAQRIYESVLDNNPNDFEALYRTGVIASQRQEYRQALSWYERANRADPSRGEIFFNYATALREERRFDEAVTAYRQALEADADDAQAHANLGLTLQALYRFVEALEHFQRAIAVDENYADCHYYRGSLLVKLGRLPEALSSYERALTLKPGIPFLEGNCLHLRMRICDWSGFDQRLARIVSGIEAGQQVIASWALCGLSDDVILQRRCAEIWAKSKVTPANPRPPLASLASRKIRIAYYSADFHEHATAYLMVELFESHDRERFDVIAFSFGPNDSSPIRQRLKSAFTQFHDVALCSDAEIAEQSRSIGIDIAVDLKGYTDQGRPDIFAFGAAPIQVSYLGYPGTLGADFVDYLVADEIVIDPNSRAGYSEHIVFLPGSYQVNPLQRAKGTLPTRAEVGLPQGAFVFCSFNSSYKILPDVFATWMRVLKRVDASVLWLYEENAISSENLRTHATACGIDPSRLIFAKREPQADHIMRQGLGDLLLDTFPCNAHTTASDALSAGLPILTRSGDSFASRVAASVLAAVDLDELVTSTDRDYEDLAVALAQHPQRLNELRTRLAIAREHSSLFDSAAFANKLENAYIKMLSRCEHGLAPCDIDGTVLEEL